MFTLRFENHTGNRYVVYSGTRYSVHDEGHPESKVDSSSGRVVRIFRSIDDDNPYFECVGADEPYGVAYVTNESGKTIDTIR